MSLFIVSLKFAIFSVVLGCLTYHLQKSEYDVFIPQEISNPFPTRNVIVMAIFPSIFDIKDYLFQKPISC